jgi:hypothetical protein
MDVAGRVQVVEDGRGVGDEVALVSGEQAVDGGLLSCFCEIAIQHVSLGRDPAPRSERLRHCSSASTRTPVASAHR